MAEVKPSRLSAGMILLRHTDAGWRYLLLRAYRNWDFPKGLVEQGESALAAARREVLEETGIDDVALRWGEQCYDTEAYANGKIARFFLACTAQDKVVFAVNPQLGRAEHHEYRWLAYDAALQLLVPRLQKALTWAEAMRARGADLLTR